MKNVPIVIVLLAVLTLGCSLFSKLANTTSGTSTNSDSPANSATGTATSSGVDSAPPSGDPRSDLIRASKKFLSLPQFTADLQGTGKNETHMQLEFQSPDRYHMTNLANHQMGMSEFVIIGKDMYVQNGGRWQKMPGAMAASMPNLRQFFDEEGLKTLKDAKYDGDETLDGQPMHVYSYQNNQINANVPYPFTSKIWVGSADGLPHKIEVAYQQGDLKTMTIAYDYNKSIDIKPPV